MSSPRLSRSRRAAGRSPRRLSAWAIVGIITAVVLTIAGLVVLAVVVAAFAGMGDYGSNK